MNNKPTDPTPLDSEIDAAMTCDKGCGHTVDPETCYKHQMQKIKDLIATTVNEAREVLFDEVYTAYSELSETAFITWMMQKESQVTGVNK